MASLVVKSFDGMEPLVDAHLLEPNKATFAENCKLFRGGLRPWKGPSDLLSLPAGQPPKTIYRYGERLAGDGFFWFTFAEDVNIVRGPIAADQYERVYFTGDTTGGADYPKYTANFIATSGSPYPSLKRRMGVPAPDAVPAGVVSGSPTDPNSLNITVVYAVTFVSDVGEEGPPSELSGEITYKQGQTITVSMPTSVPSGWSGSNGIIKKRLYRSGTGSNATQLQFVSEHTLATASTADTKAQSELGEVIPSTRWLPPPAAMRGLCLGANGVMAGFFDNTVCFSESFMPHAWPTQFQQATEYPIVAIGAFGQSWLVATTGNPYVMSGADGESVTAEKCALKQACVSKRSLVEIEGGVVYASPDGLVVANSNGISVATRNIISREDWQAINPSSIFAFQYDGKYFACYDTGVEKGVMVFDFSGSGATLSKFDFGTFVPSGGQYDISRDALYIAGADGANNKIIKFESGGWTLTATWQSKKFIFPAPVSMSRILVDGEFILGQVHVALIAHTASGPVTLFDAWAPPGEAFAVGYSSATHRNLSVEVTLIGQAMVSSIVVADSMKELLQVSQ